MNDLNQFIRIEEPNGPKWVKLLQDTCVSAKSNLKFESRHFDNWKRTTRSTFTFDEWHENVVVVPILITMFPRWFRACLSSIEVVFIAVPFASFFGFCCL